MSLVSDGSVKFEPPHFFLPVFGDSCYGLLTRARVARTNAYARADAGSCAHAHDAHACAHAHVHVYAHVYTDDGAHSAPHGHADDGAHSVPHGHGCATDCCTRCFASNLAAHQ